MTQYISPLVDVNEIDLSTTIPAVATAIGVIIVRNTWKGDELKVKLVNSIDELIEAFGRPEAASDIAPVHGQSYEDLLAGTGFLQFAQNLYCTRVLPPSATFAGVYGTIDALIAPSSSSSSSSTLSSSSESSISIACDEFFGYHEPTNEIDVGGQLITIRTVIPSSYNTGGASKIRLIIENNNADNGDVTEMWFGRSAGGPTPANFNGGQQQVLVGGSGSFTLSGGGYKTTTDEITINILDSEDHVVSMYYNGDNPSNYWSGLPGCDIWTLVGSNESGNTTFTGTLSGSNQIYGLNAICITELPS